MLAQANCRELPLAADSVDLIFTDPPYLREYLPCYGWLAREAARVLKPGGFVLAIAPMYALPEVMQMMADHLSWFWQLTVDHTGMGAMMWAWKIVARSKPILAYSKGKAIPRTKVLNRIEGSGPDKKYHHWGQDTGSAAYFVECFSSVGDLVLDPFIGGGTTAVACELIGRRCVGFDLDPAALATSRDRLAQADILHSLPLFAQASGSHRPDGGER